MSPWTSPAGDAPKRPQVVPAVVLAMALAWGGSALAEEAAVVRMGGSLAPVVVARDLRLDVSLNGTRLDLIGSFVQMSDGRLAATAAELQELGIEAPESDAPVPLDTLAGLGFDYDEARQSIALRAGPERMVVRRLGSRGDAREVLPAARSDWGVATNYVFFAGASQEIGLDWKRRFDGASLTLDARAFSPFGVFSQSGILGRTTGAGSEALRLDSTFTHVDEDRLLTWRAGDLVSGGLAWTRPVRLGGVQVQKNFSLRSDLVTLPLPLLSGTAAVPSAVDVYVNGMKMQSNDGVEGRFRIADTPSVTGGGEARVVVRDATGREVVTTSRFYVTPAMLRPGLWDFSVEGGAPRTGFGTDGFHYHDDRAFMSWTLRSGVTDWLTFEGHGEFGDRFGLAGAGLVASVMGRGAVTGAVSASRWGTRTGGQIYLDGETRLFGASLHVGTQRTVGDYYDIAAISADADFETRLARIVAAQGASALSAYSLAGITSTRPARGIDRVSIGLPLPGGRSSVSLSYAAVTPWQGSRSRIVGLTAATTVWEGWLFGSLNADFGDDRSFFAHVGWSRSLGAWGQASVGATGSRGSVRAATTLAKGLDTDIGAVGWRLSDEEGGIGNRSGELSYRAALARVTGRASQAGSQTSGSIEVEGAVVAMPGGVFATGRIDDAFALVDAGAPGVTILQENRPVGRTDGRGRLLVPSLRSWEANHFAIDATGLPVDAQPARTDLTVRPRGFSGVTADFGVVTARRSAEILLVDAAGRPLELGRSGRSRSGTAFEIGYDGRTWLEAIEEHDVLEVAGGPTPCRAEVEVPVRPGRRVTIGPVVCR